MHPKDTTGYLWLAVVKVFDGTASGGGDCPVSVCKRAGALELQQILLHLVLVPLCPKEVEFVHLPLQVFLLQFLPFWRGPHVGVHPLRYLLGRAHLRTLCFARIIRAKSDRSRKTKS